MKNLSSILYKIKYLSYSIITIGVLFKTNNWPGANSLIIAGGLSLSLMFLITAFGNPPSNNDDKII